MGFDRRFEIGLAWRLGVVLLAFALLIVSLQTPGLAAARIVAIVLTGLVLGSLWTFVRRTNFEVARFVESLRFEDFSQRFTATSGGGFDILGAALDGAMSGLRDRRAALSDEARFLSLVIDDTPVALLTVTDDGLVTLLNKAARRQFDRHRGTRLADFAAYGVEFAAALALPPGERRLTRLVVDGVAQRAMLAAARVERLGTGLTIASLLPVQGELDTAELAAQSDLVRVLTHEIMNSLTPVTSLARITAELVAEAAARDPSLADAHLAVETLANRADGILRFIDSYRQFARSLELRRRRFDVGEWAAQIAVLAAADPRSSGVDFAVDSVGPALFVDADPDLLAQVALNLIRNAALATQGQADRRVRLSAAATQDRRVLIEVIDNGPGVLRERRDDVFLPFYTTRTGGTGVGLSFARQVVIAHGGKIVVDDAPDGGAIVRILL